MTSSQTWIVATNADRPVHVGSLLALFGAEGWWPERTEELMTAVIATGPAVGAWIDGRLVGFARAVSDGAFRAYVEDVIVAKPARRLGVARELLEVLLKQLPPNATVSLFCASNLGPLYQEVGFQPAGQLVMHRGPVG